MWSGLAYTEGWCARIGRLLTAITLCCITASTGSLCVWHLTEDAQLAARTCKLQVLKITHRANTGQRFLVLICYRWLSLMSPSVANQNQKKLACVCLMCYLSTCSLQDLAANCATSVRCRTHYDPLESVMPQMVTALSSWLMHAGQPSCVCCCCIIKLCTKAY